MLAVLNTDTYYWAKSCSSKGSLTMPIIKYKMLDENPVINEKKKHLLVF